MKIVVPKKIHIETVIGCNARCAMCPNSTDDLVIKTMNEELFKKIVQEIALIEPSPSIKLSLNGEPLLDEQIVKRIKYIKNLKNIRVSMNTNAALLNKRKSDEILQSGLDRINFHISGFSRKTYDDVMIGLDYELTMRNVLHFIDRAKNSNSQIVIAVKYVVLDGNRHELEDAKKFWLSKGVLFRPDVLDDRLGASINYNKLRADYDVIMENTICPLIFEQMFIRHNGDVVSCWSDWYGERIFGNCDSSSILNIFNSSLFDELRAEHINNNKYSDNICSKCHWVDKEKYEI